MSFKAYKTDANHNVIAANRELVDILEVAVTAVAWFAVTIPTDVYTKQLHLSTLDAAAFKISNTVTGTKSVQLPSGLWMDFAAMAGDTIFWVQGTTITTFQVLLMV